MTTNLNLGDIVQLEHQVRMKRAHQGCQAEMAARATRRPAPWTAIRLSIGNAFVGIGQRLQGATPSVAGHLGQEAV